MEEETRFRTAVQTQWSAIWAFAKHMQCQEGYGVTINPPMIRPSIDEKEGFGDEADLMVFRRYEIKGRGIDFTCAEDYPYETVFVDRVDKVDKVRGHVYAYVSINKAETHAAFIAASTYEQWKRRETFDTVKGYSLTVYECPKHLVRFFALRQQ